MDGKKVAKLEIVLASISKTKTAPITNGLLEIQNPGSILDLLHMKFEKAYAI